MLFRDVLLGAVGLLLLIGVGVMIFNPRIVEVTSKTAEVRLSVVNAKPQSDVVLDGKIIGQINEDGRLDSTFKIKKGSTVNIEFKASESTFWGLYSKDAAIKSSLQVATDSTIVCDGKTEDCKGSQN